jgi:ATP synthase subunit D
LLNIPFKTPKVTKTNDIAADFQVIKITNRRVNAIEHVIIPKIERTLAYIISELVSMLLKRRSYSQILD